MRPPDPIYPETYFLDRASWMQDVVTLTRRVRDAQKLYFKTRGQSELINSKQLEAELDTLLKRYIP